MEGERGSERNPLSRIAKIRRGSKKKCERKVAAVARGERGRRRESARPLTSVSGVAASAIKSKRNGENPIEGSRDRAQARTERGFSGKEREEREETRERISREEKKDKESKDMREAR